MARNTKRETKDEFLTLRLQADLLERLQTLATRNERTVAGEVRLAIRQHLVAQEADGKVAA